VSEIAVELADLRGFAQQVGRASNDMGAAKDYAVSNIHDADFGKILELITGPYGDMLPKFHAVLQADSTGLGKTRDGLNHAAAGYKEADEKSAGRLAQLPGGQTGNITDDGVANGFDDTGSATSQLKTPGGEGAALPDLPEVSFGWIFDKVCDLVVWVGGPDPREKVTRWIAGDIDKAAMQVTAWHCVANCADVVQANLNSGKKSIANTWTGDASNAAAGHMDKWTTNLHDQADAMRKMGEHLRTMINEAVKMAQVVVDIIQTLVSLISAALSNAAIPFYGQWKLIKTVKEGIQMVWKAIKVIQVFLNALRLIINTIQMCVTAFTTEKLPPAPAVPA
jgi:uncharacterized protein YukE